MKQPHNSNGANRPDPQPKPPPLDTAAEEQIEKIFDSVLADNRQRLRDMEADLDKDAKKKLPF